MKDNTILNLDRASLARVPNLAELDFSQLANPSASSCLGKNSKHKLENFNQTIRTWLNFSEEEYEFQFLSTSSEAFITLYRSFISQHNSVLCHFDNHPIILKFADVVDFEKLQLSDIPLRSLVLVSWLSPLSGICYQDILKRLLSFRQQRLFYIALDFSQSDHGLSPPNLAQFDVDFAFFNFSKLVGLSGALLLTKQQLRAQKLMVKPLIPAVQNSFKRGGTLPITECLIVEYYLNNVLSKLNQLKQDQLMIINHMRSELKSINQVCLLTDKYNSISLTIIAMVVYGVDSKLLQSHLSTHYSFSLGPACSSSQYSTFLTPILPLSSVGKNYLRLSFDWAEDHEKLIQFIKDFKISIKNFS